MTDETGTATGDAGDGGETSETSGGTADEERRSTRDRVSEGFQRGLGVLSAFKDALEETIAEARDKGDLSTDRARQVMRGAMERARDATSDARERFDFVTQQEFDQLARRVAELEARLRSED